MGSRVAFLSNVSASNEMHLELSLCLVVLKYRYAQLDSSGCDSFHVLRLVGEHIKVGDTDPEIGQAR